MQSGKASSVRIAITANRDLVQNDHRIIASTITGVCELAPDEMIFGGARGGDSVSLRVAHAKRDARTRLIVIVPDTVAAQPRDAQKDICECADEVIELGYAITRDDGFAAFRNRNATMVTRATHVGGFWNGDRRSGTWSTLCMARRAMKPWWVVFVEGGDVR